MRLSDTKALVWLPVGLLLAAIVVHAVRIEQYDADPQRGSAFAMFSTVDIAATRRVIATVPGDPTIRLEIPAHLEKVGLRLRDAPSEDVTRELAILLLESRWEVEGDTAKAGGTEAFDEVRVEVVGLESDGRVLSRQIFSDVVAFETAS